MSRQTFSPGSTPDGAKAAALGYLAAGFSIIPIRPRDKRPLVAWKPFQRRRATPEEVEGWYQRWPNAGVGIVTGAISGIIVLDVDGEPGVASLRELLPQTPEGVPEGIVSWIVGTPRGGWHVYFAHPGGAVANFAKRRPGLDRRGDGGYVVAPPSGGYEWITSPGEAALADCAAWLRALLARPGGNGDGQRAPGPEDIPEGARNDTLYRFARRLHARGMMGTEILAALLTLNASRCRPPLPEAEVREIAAHAATQADRPTDIEVAHLTDLGNAERLVVQHGDRLRFCKRLGQWFVWDGRRWKPDETGEVERLAKETVRTIYAEAAAEADPARRVELAKHARASEAAGRIAAMVTLAATEQPVVVRVEELDADPWVLNVENGTVDLLRTGTLRPHRREDLITKLAPVHYDPAARDAVWEQYLDRVLPNPRVRDYVQRALGYSLVGDPREEKVFFVHGPQATGKTTLLEAVKSALGDYARTADFETFLKRRGEAGIRNDLARLAGARVVCAIEVEEGRAFAEGLLKHLSGGDTVAARFLYKEHFEFRPQFTLWLAANHRPAVSAHDGALWRRLVLVPFTEVIPKAERDPAVKAHLQHDRGARAALLAWLVEGCVAWQRQGLGEVDTVETYTETYRQEQDPLAGWLGGDPVRQGLTTYAVVLDPRLATPAATLWQHYLDWCRDQDEEPLSRDRWGRALTEKGLIREKRSGGVRVRRGIGLEERKGSE